MAGQGGPNRRPRGGKCHQKEPERDKMEPERRKMVPEEALEEEK